MTNLNREDERYFPLITLPLPPTDNDLKQPVIRYKAKRPYPTVVPTKNYSAWKSEMKTIWAIWLAQNRDFKPYDPSEKMFLLFNFVIYLPNWRRDAQNHTKALRDGLTGKLYTDDRYTLVLPSQTHKPQIDKNNPRIVLDPNPTLME